MHAADLLHLHTTELEQQEGHRLSSKNDGNRTKYLKAVHSHLSAHNVFEKVGWLSSQKNVEINEAQQLEYNKVGNTITEAFLHGENSLPG